LESERSFTAGGFNFKLLKVNALEQFHIVRRIGPLLSEIIPSLSQIKAKAEDTDKLTEEQKLAEFGKILAPLMTGLSKLSDSDANFVLFRLLSAVEVEQKEFGSWTRIATHDGIKMQNIDLPILLQAAGRALMFNLSGFLALRPQK
jgi:hypothetical protein